MEAQHFKLYKPYGYISQFISNQPKSYKKKFLGTLYPFPSGTMAIGRLDEKSEGLLLLTTCGKTSAYITGSKVEKEYFVQVDGEITDTAVKKLTEGVEIGFDGKKYTTLPCNVKKIDAPNVPERVPKVRDDRHGPTTWIAITLKEGKFRQVRKMTAATGFATLRLIRVRVGEISLGNMKLGDVEVLKSIHLM